MSGNGASREECLYCHNNSAPADRACPVCGAWKVKQEEDQEKEFHFFAEKFDPDFLAAYP